jgi:hypothetical protein
MALLLYALAATLLLWLSHRHVTPLSRSAAAILFFLPFVFVGYALVTSRVYGPIDHAWEFVPLNWMKEQYGLGVAHNGYLSDVSTQMIPWRAAVRWSLAHGELPLWNRFILGGDVLAAAAQPAAFSPFTLIACLLPAPLSMTFSAAVAHLVGALGAFLLARELGCSEPASCIAAVGFTYASAVALFILWPHGLSWALAPFVLMAIHRRSLSLLTIGFTLLVLAGHPESALHVVTLAGAFALVVVPLRTLPRLALAGGLALLLSAFYVLPLVEAAPQTHEFASRHAIYASIPRGVSSPEVLARLATDILPNLHTRRWQVAGVPEELPVDTAAVGSIILALALCTITRARSRLTWFFAAVVVFGLLARSGWAPLARALQKLPLFDVSLNERFAFAAALALAMLAAMAIDAIDRRALLTIAIVAVVLVVGNLWVLRAQVVTDAPPVWGKYKLAAELLGLGAVLALARTPRLLLLALVAQRFVAEGGIYRSHEQRLANPPIPMLEPLRDVREPFRITGHGLAFIPGTSSYYGLEDIRGNQALTFRRTFETFPLWSIHQPVSFNRVDDLKRPFLSFLNVRYAITWDRDPPPPGWREVSRQKGSMLLENTRALPRAFVPRNVRVGHDALAEMANETDFGDRAWIERTALVPHERANGPGTVVTHDARLGYILDVNMDNDGFVVASLPAWKGWHAFIDGRRAPTHFANHAFLGVRVPRGTHRVRLVYLPSSFVLGSALSALTLLSVAGYRLSARFREKAQTTDN